MNDYKLDLEKYATLARQAAAEGCVLLENEKQALPLREGESVAVFGRMAFHYYKSGLGSGGLVNTRYVVGILDALKECKEIQLDEKLLGIYANWIKENPYDEGQGWGRVPWSQKEMEVTEEMLDCARSNDVSLVIIGRTAGEDQDNNTNLGSYCLTETEEDLICRVCEVSKCTVVVLNVGNIIDMSWVEKYHPQAVLYAWQGGQEGGNGVADVLTGKVCACGKLTDTIAERIEYYPSTENFGDPYKNYYKEDIYVGYRYFETFAKDKVLYPFGYGLSYTNFETKAEIFAELDKDYVSGITFSGGDPLHPANITEVTAFAKEIRKRYPGKTIWLYTGFLWEEICKEEIVRYLDVCVDGEFEVDKKELSLKWKGSSNQRVIDVPKTLHEGKVVLHK